MSPTPKLPISIGADGKAKGHARAQPLVNHVRWEPYATRDKARMGSPILRVKVPFVPSPPSVGVRHERIPLYGKGLLLWPVGSYPLGRWPPDANPYLIALE
jgi:hypothetical protein